MSHLEISAIRVPEQDRILTHDALAFLLELEQRFGARRRALLERRQVRRAAFRAGTLPGFLPETREIRDASWRVAPAPADLDDRRVEITGPVERKMMINALNSGARVFMADFEDALSPSWANVIGGQLNCVDAVRRRLDYTAPDGKRYQLNPAVATLVIRPRGWHLREKHLRLHGQPVSGSLADFGLYFFHNAAELLRRGSGPYFYLPKLESHEEARLWNDVFIAAQELLGIPRGTIRATVLIETILAAFEMEEILFELREHAAGLNAGRWDYIFSLLKNFGHRPDFLLPDRSQVTMTVPFMRAYTEQLVRACHRRGAHAIGGMAAFIPSRRDAEANARALAKVQDDKQREAGDGFDGSWVAHPDLVPVAQAAFDRVLGSRPNQKDRLREEVVPDAKALLRVAIPGGTVTESGVRADVKVAIEYIENWLEGRGAVGIDNLMEDSATAEISRMQLQQWVRLEVKLAEGSILTRARYGQIRQEELAGLLAQRPDAGKLHEAAALLDRLVDQPIPEEFLTLGAYEYLE
ncbi:MAG TPA: malate synthase A [Gemmatimonadales bacterium]|nr:malate synthase A [Gemmatimonadales bacterium]